MIAALGGLYWRVYSSGYDNGKAKVQQEWNDAVEDQRDRDRMASLTAAKALQDDRRNRKVVIQERTIYVDREIEKLVDAGPAFTPSGVSCLNSAIKGSGTAGQCVDGTVPASVPAR